MGEIRDAIKAFDGTSKHEQELEQRLDEMSALADAKVELFKLQLADRLLNVGAGGNENIPVKFILDFTRQTHAYAGSSANDIVGTVTAAVRSFVRGGADSIINGMGGLMSRAVTGLFGSRTRAHDEVSFMSVMTQGRALVRVDMMGWKRFTNVESLSKSAEQISAFVMSRSTIDVLNLDFNTFLALYQDVLYAPEAGLDPQAIKQQLVCVEQVYEQFLAAEQKQRSLAATGAVAWHGADNQLLAATLPAGRPSMVTAPSRDQIMAAQRRADAAASALGW